MKKVILEIIINKDNDKGSSVFEDILIVLHKSYDDYHDKGFFGGEFIIKSPFSFEMSKIGNRIGFYFICSKKYSIFLKNHIYSKFDDIEINETSDYLFKIPDSKIIVGKIGLSKHYAFSIKDFNKGDKDPYGSLLGALSKIGDNSFSSIQVNFVPIEKRYWYKGKDKIIKILSSKYPTFIKNILINKKIIFISYLFLPFFWILKLIALFFRNNVSKKNKKINPKFIHKFEGYGYYTDVNIIYAGDEPLEGKVAISDIFQSFGVYNNLSGNSFILKSVFSDSEKVNIIKNRILTSSNSFILNTKELSQLVHFPKKGIKVKNISYTNCKSLEPPSNLPVIDKNNFNKITPIGEIRFRGKEIAFGIEKLDRGRHMYIIGKTGMGKSTLLENMILDDISKGRGVAVIDPHGDLAESIIGLIPKSRTNQTIIFDPSDIDSPIGFNMLDGVDYENRSFVASGLVGVFKKIFGNSWGPRLEHILRNTILALTEYPKSTLISIPLMLTSDSFRNKVIASITDPVVKNFWKYEYSKMSPTQKVDAAGPILNKVGQFLSSTILRNILGQNKNSFSIRWVMDNKKILIINLSKGKIGEDASALLGSMLVTKFQIDAMSRADIKEKDRVDFYLYVDEFQNFATDSFATILSEARKYKLNLVMANQYIDQMTKEIKGAVFGNVGSIISFQVGYNDAKILKGIYAGEVLEEDLMNVKKYNIYSKILVDGMPTKTFLASTFSSRGKDNKKFRDRYDKILKVSREKYSKPRKYVEENINKTLSLVEKENKDWENRKKEFKK